MGKRVNIDGPGDDPDEYWFECDDCEGTGTVNFTDLTPMKTEASASWAHAPAAIVSASFRAMRTTLMADNFVSREQALADVGAPKPELKAHLACPNAGSEALICAGTSARSSSASRQFGRGPTSTSFRAAPRPSASQTPIRGVRLSEQ